MSNNAVDDYTFLKNFHYSMPSDKVVETTWMYQNDTTSSNYDSGKIEFDLSQFANNGTTNWQDWSRALLVIPLVITLNNNGGVGLSNRSDLALALKRSYVNLVNSVLLRVNTKSFTNNNPLNNIPAYFTQLVSASQDDLKNKSFLGLDHLDNPMSVDYVTATPGTANNVKSYNGNGILCNTCLTPAQEAAYNTPFLNKGDMNNTGFYNRTRQFRNINQLATVLQDEPALKNEAKDYTFCKANFGVANADANAATNDADGRKTTYQVYYTTAIIKLSDICGGYFQNLGLVKGAHYVSLTLDINCQGSMRIARTATGAPAVDNVFTGSTFNFTNPIQVNPTGIAAAGASDICISIGIVKPPGSLISGYDGTQHNVLGLSHSMSNCRIYIPSVKLTLDAETALISKGVSKKVSFIDFQYNTTTVTARNNLTMVISNSVKNAVGLLIVPMISRSVNGKINNAGTPFSVLQSPFYPAVPCPLSLTQLNVNIGSRNVFPQNVNYTWEMFVEQIAGLKSTNGGQEYGLSSCLLSKSDWENMYRYYYVNFPDSGDNSTSVSLSCYNNNSVDVDLLIFILTSKTALVDIITGQVESSSF